MNDTFDLQCVRGGSGYSAQVLASPAGESRVEHLPLLEPTALVDEMSHILQMLFDAAEAGPEAWHGLDLPALESRIAKVGTDLFTAVFSGHVLDRYRSSRDLCRARGVRLLVRLRSQDEALWDLPWEYLHEPDQGGQYLFATSDIAFVRYLEAPSPPAPLATTLPLKILVIAADPEGKLDVDFEWRRLNTELGEAIANGLVILDRVVGATLGSLVDSLNEDDYHVIHFIGHGGFDPERREGYLVLESADGRQSGREVFAGDLAQHLSGRRSIRLVVLNCCESAAADAGNPFSGVAQALVRATTPAVIAMRSTIFDGTAILLATEVYGHIAQGQSIDRALSRARGRLLAADGAGRLEWGTPQLYLRTTDGVLFDVTKPAEQDASELRTIARQLFHLGRFAEAENRLMAALARFPDDSEARDELDAVRQRRDREPATELIAQGDAFEGAGDLTSAKDHYYRARALNVGRDMVRNIDERLNRLRRVGRVDGGADLSVHIDNINEYLEHGDLTLFFGPDVIMASRASDHKWEPGRDIPTYAELADHLAVEFSSVDPEPRSISRIAQYLSMSRSERLLESLHRLFRNVNPTTVHYLLADIFEEARARPPIMVSSNYDDLLVRAYVERKLSFDLLCFTTREDGERPKWRGFVHTRFRDGEPDEPVEIHEPHSYQDLQPGEVPCIIKMYGMIDRQNGAPAYDALVVSEDQHLRYVREERISKSLPTTVLKVLQNTHHLFLGQNLRDWTVRGAFAQIIRQQNPKLAWVVQPGATAEERAYWMEYVPRVVILDIALSDFVATLGWGRA